VYGEEFQIPPLEHSASEMILSLFDIRGREVWIDVVFDKRAIRIRLKVIWIHSLQSFSLMLNAMEL
jgi:hypothetical protein